jgi:hypothetical protein
VPWRTVGVLLLLTALLVATAVIGVGLRRDTDPAPPFGLAANGIVAVVSDFDLYSRDIESGERALLVGGPELDVFPVFSRDGQSLAWARIESDEPRAPATLMVADADGSDARALVGPLVFDWAAWSPSSEELAMISNAEGDGNVLSIVPVDGGEQQTIDLPVEPLGFVEWRPPAGDELLFLARQGERRAVYGVQPDGSGFRQISDATSGNSFWAPADITPDGSTMVLTRGSGAARIAMLDLDTGDLRGFGSELPPVADLTGTEHHATPLISPDATSLLFDRYWGEMGGEVTHQLYLASLDGDGAGAVPVGPVHRNRSLINPFYRAFAPDGTAILIHAEGTSHGSPTPRVVHPRRSRGARSTTSSAGSAARRSVDDDRQRHCRGGPSAADSRVGMASDHAAALEVGEATSADLR